MYVCMIMSQNVTKVPVLIVLTKVADRLQQMAVTQSMGKIVDCDINAKFYVQSAI